MADPAAQYSAGAQARSLVGLIGELALGPVVLVGYDIGSRIAQAVARDRPDLVRAYLRHFWSHWSGPGYEPSGDHLDHLVSVYRPPGAFAASIAWYQAGRGRSPPS